MHFTICWWISQFVGGISKQGLTIGIRRVRMYVYWRMYDF